MILERDVENYLTKEVEKRGGRCFKLPAIYEEGIPDRLVVIPVNKITFVELKRPKGGRLSPVQKYQIGKLKDMGCKVYVVKNKEEIDKMLKEIEISDI